MRPAGPRDARVVGAGRTAKGNDEGVTEPSGAGVVVEVERLRAELAAAGRRSLGCRGRTAVSALA